jgi:thiol-disulfide isomerase/thioredoxin
MRSYVAVFMILASAALSSRAIDKPDSKGSDEYEGLKKELVEAQQKYSKDVREAKQAVDDAKTDEDKQAAQKKFEMVRKNLPGSAFAPRFLEFAEKNPKDSKAFEAARTAFSLSFNPAARKDGNGSTREAVLSYFQKNYADKPQIKSIARMLEGLGDAAGEPLFRAIMEKNPDARMQAHACKALSAITKKEGEKEELNKLLAGKYAEFCPDLSVGKPIPEVVSQNLEGKEVKMSDLKGKVAVIDIWATWCGPCRAMIPHEREMVEHFKEKPFTFVSVSIDATKEKLTEFLEKEKMPWTHWWAGADAGWIEDWDVKFIPTIYVVDAKGIIRFKDVRGEELEKAVASLLKDTDEKKPSDK